MDYVVSRRQIKNLAFKYFDKIFGDIKPKVGKNYSYVFVDSRNQGRVGYNKTIHFGRVYLVLDEDYENFIKIIPVSKQDFARLFTTWMNDKFAIGEVNRLTTVPRERLEHLNLCVQPYCNN
jgi:hypothetical protein